ncbi:ParB family protein [Nocardia rhamnosiphila]
MTAATPEPVIRAQPHRPAGARRGRTMTPQYYGMRPQEAAGMAETSAKTTNKGRIGAYFGAEEAARVRGAYAHGWLQDHSGSLSDFVKSLVMAEVERLEKEKNGGQPFAGIEADGVRVYTHQQIADKRRSTES